MSTPAKICVLCNHEASVDFVEFDTATLKECEETIEFHKEYDTKFSSAVLPRDVDEHRSYHQTCFKRFTKVTAEREGGCDYSGDEDSTCRSKISSESSSVDAGKSPKSCVNGVQSTIPSGSLCLFCNRNFKHCKDGTNQPLLPLRKGTAADEIIAHAKHLKDEVMFEKICKQHEQKLLLHYHEACKDDYLKKQKEDIAWKKFCDTIVKKRLIDQRIPHYFLLLQLLWSQYLLAEGLEFEDTARGRTMGWGLQKLLDQAFPGELKFVKIKKDIKVVKHRSKGKLSDADIEALERNYEVGLAAVQKAESRIRKEREEARAKENENEGEKREDPFASVKNFYYSLLADSENPNDGIDNDLLMEKIEFLTRSMISMSVDK